MNPPAQEAPQDDNWDLLMHGLKEESEEDGDDDDWKMGSEEMEADSDEVPPRLNYTHSILIDSYLGRLGVASHELISYSRTLHTSVLASHFTVLSC